MSAEDYQQESVGILLKEIFITGLPARTSGFAYNAFVTVSVDGQQQLQTEAVETNTSPQWSFSRTRVLEAYPSSLLCFTVYHKHKHLSGSRCLGSYEAPLFEYLTQDGSEFPIVIKHGIKSYPCVLKTRLKLDTSGAASATDDALQDATTKLYNIKIHQTEPKTTGTALLEALDNLDQLVKVVDGLTEAHPWCKTAWTLLSAVYKALRGMRERDGKVRELSIALRDALARARHCRDLKAIPGASNVVKSLARLVAQGATLIDEYMKHSRAGKYARAAVGLSSTIDARIENCRLKLRDLYQELTLDLTINHWESRKGSSGESSEQTGQRGQGPPPTSEPQEPHVFPCYPGSWNTTPSPPPVWNISHSSRYNVATRHEETLPGAHPHSLKHFPVPYADSSYQQPLSTSPDSLQGHLPVPGPQPYPTATSPLSRKSKYQSLPPSQPSRRPPPLAQRRDILDYQQDSYTGHASFNMPYTSAPLPMTPALSVSASSDNDDNGVPPTPASEHAKYPPEFGGVEAAYFKDIGGFTIPGGTYPPSNVDHSRRHTLPGWVPGKPL